MQGYYLIFALPPYTPQSEVPLGVMRTFCVLARDLEDAASNAVSWYGLDPTTTFIVPSAAVQLVAQRAALGGEAVRFEGHFGPREVKG